MDAFVHVYRKTSELEKARIKLAELRGRYPGIRVSDKSEVFNTNLQGRARDRQHDRDRPDRRRRRHPAQGEPGLALHGRIPEDGTMRASLPTPSPTAPAACPGSPEPRGNHEMAAHGKEILMGPRRKPRTCAVPQSRIGRLARFHLEGFIHVLAYRLMVPLTILYGLLIIAYLAYRLSGRAQDRNRGDLGPLDPAAVRGRQGACPGVVPRDGLRQPQRGVRPPLPNEVWKETRALTFPFRSS